jgi:hypothetical protein
VAIDPAGGPAMEGRDHRMLLHRVGYVTEVDCNDARVVVAHMSIATISVEHIRLRPERARNA